LVLQALYGLSDEQAEYQIRDRLSFMRFLGLGLGARVPDEKTIWLFRELLVRAGAIDKLFDRFEAELEEQGYLAMSGQLVDASLVVNAEVNFPILAGVIFPTCWGIGDRPGLDQAVSFRGLPRRRLGAWSGL
jgi:IS5 family transposase